MKKIEYTDARIISVSRKRLKAWMEFNKGRKRCEITPLLLLGCAFANLRVGMKGKAAFSASPSFPYWYFDRRKNGKRN